MKITAEFSWEAAHRLPLLPSSHKCHNLHGHNYRMVVGIDGPLDARGFVMDYAELEAIVGPLIAQLDHRYLNDIDGLECPTTEVIVNWMLARIKPHIGNRRVTVTVFETPRYSAEASA